MNVVIGALGAVMALLAAALWFWASLVEVPDNIDAFICVLQRIGRLNSYAALAAAVAALRETPETPKTSCGALKSHLQGGNP
jgi:hypothetical protein